MSTEVCPGCVGGGMAAETAAASLSMPTHELILPGIHCLGCIRGVEKILNDIPGIEAARVNLSRKRAAIVATPGADPGPWIDALATGGYEAHEARADGHPEQGQDLVLRLGIAGFAMMNVMLLSVAVWSGATDATRDLFHWVSAIIALPAALYCAQPFFTNAWSALRAFRLNMDVPISLAIILACAISLYETLNSGHHAYFDAALSLTFFLLAGRVLEARMRRVAKSAAADLAALEPRRVSALRGGVSTSIPIDAVVEGDTLFLAAGARVPVDATLLDRETSIDRSALTGESDPVALQVGAHLTAGEVVLMGPVAVRAVTVGENSTLRRMIHLASIAEGARTRYTSLADRAAALYAPLVHGLSAAAFVGWFVATGDVHKAAMIAISTLIITCPCALGLAVPAVSAVAVGRLFRVGVLVKSETAMERLAEVDTVFFDKTGTLTESKLIVPPDLGPAERQVLRALAEASDHPLSKSIAAQLRDVAPAHLSNIREHAGKGLSAEFEGRRVRLGSGNWIGCAHDNVFEFDGERFALERREVAIPEAYRLVEKLKSQGMPIHLLTGDVAHKARAMAEELGVDAVHSNMTPEAKLDLVESFQTKGARVLMVGDGLNDTLALTSAWASIAPGTALEASQNAADAVILSGRLDRVVDALRISRAARRRILENFAMAATYNAISIPVALSGLATPLAAALAMSTSSILVTLNALRVR